MAIPLFRYCNFRNMHWLMWPISCSKFHCLGGVVMTTGQTLHSSAPGALLACLQCLLSAQASWLCQVCITASSCKRICICMYVCVYVCMYVCMHACMYVCMYVCMHVCMTYVCMTYVCVCVCVCACMHACMYVGCR